MEIGSSSNKDEIDLRELLDIVWLKKKLVVAITSVFAVCSIIYSLTLSNEYRAIAVLVPTEKSSNLLSKVSSGLGGMSLPVAGLNLDSSNTDSKVALEIMSSWKFIETFIKDNNLQVYLSAAEGWDSNSNKVLINERIYDLDTKKWIPRLFSKNKESEPSSWDLFEEFSKKLAISEDRFTKHVTVHIDFYSPIVAKEWVDKFVEAINEKMRLRNLEELNRNINRLKEQIQTTEIKEMKSALSRIMEDQLRSKLIAEMSSEYTYTTVNPAMVAEEKVRPVRSLIVIISTLLGGILAVLFVIIREIFNKK